MKSSHCDTSEKLFEISAVSRLNSSVQEVYVQYANLLNAELIAF